MAAKKVLIVDDSPLVVQWVKAALFGTCDVLGVTSAIDVPVTVYQEQPDLILLDVKMPVLRGDHIVKLVRESLSGRKVSILLHSSLPAKELEVIANECGADGFLEKTDDVDAFITTIDELLKG